MAKSPNLSRDDAATKASNSPKNGINTGFHLDAQLAELAHFAEKNQTLLIALTAAILLGISGLLYWNYHIESLKDDAAFELEKSMTHYKLQQFQLAIEGDTASMGLKKVAEKYGSTPSGNHAFYYLGCAYLQRLDYTNALKAFESVSGTSFLSAAALAGEATCYEQEKKFDKAAKLFQKAAKNTTNDALAPIYYFDAARNFERSGDLKTAYKVHQLLAKEYNRTTQGREAEKSMQRLKPFAD